MRTQKNGRRRNDHTIECVTNLLFKAVRLAATRAKNCIIWRKEHDGFDSNSTDVSVISEDTLAGDGMYLVHITHVL
jgi:hypothetical protein